ncbi:MAG: hypothetical protein EOP39_17495 [Rubrivivax sp.]|nr:MAG: hypothetical protein EOP39_17495 [Rubrivivax sp.]
MRILICCLLLAASTVHAQNEVLPPVKTELKRDSRVLPYAQLNGLLTRFRQHGEGLFRADFQIPKDKTDVPIADLKLAVRSDDADYPIKIDSDGRFDLPVLPEAEAKTADIATNVPTGKKMAIKGTVELTTPPDKLDLATVRRAMRVARTLRDELLPWYLRWLFPRMEGVRICSDTPTWELEWRENGKLMGLPLSAASTEREPDTTKGEPSRPCTLLTGQENWPDDARLLPPPGTKLSIKV